ncbi:MAG: hypothetical protein R3225_08170 [Halofilum sp. (in: g-proteobacteria)]|nr:hypothetical protein [Halofilum sp. (in: g-proteobacteria)]
MSLRLLLVLLLGAAVPVAVAAGFRAEFLAASRAPMDNPHDLKLSPDGRYLFVSDVGNDRVLALDPDSLEALGSFGDDHQDGTHDIDFDAEGRMHVADTHNGRVTIYDMDGLQATLAGVLSDRIRGPEGVLVHPNGRVYVAGAWSGNVVAYAAGDVVAELGGLSAPHDLELAPGGDIWLADAGNDRMLLLSPQLEIRRELKGAALGLQRRPLPGRAGGRHADRRRQVQPPGQGDRGRRRADRGARRRPARPGAGAVQDPGGDRGPRRHPLDRGLGQ